MGPRRRLVPRRGWRQEQQEQRQGGGHQRPTLGHGAVEQDDGCLKSASQAGFIFEGEAGRGGRQHECKVTRRSGKAAQASLEDQRDLTVVCHGRVGRRPISLVLLCQRLNDQRRPRMGCGTVLVRVTIAMTKNTRIKNKLGRKGFFI